MRPKSESAQKITGWINQSTGWFAYFNIDRDLGIENRRDKTLRRVIVKRLYDRGLLIRAPNKQGIYKRFIPAKEINWRNYNKGL